MRYMKIRSRNHSAHGLRRKIRTNGHALLRLGSTTPMEEIFPNGIPNNCTILNSVEACKISGNKVLMKRAFDSAEIITAEWGVVREVLDDWDTFPAIVKHRASSKGNGIYLIQNAQELRECMEDKSPETHIIEKYYTYSKEYRIHIIAGEPVISYRKMLQRDAVERWHRHDDNSVWICEHNPETGQPNPLFAKPGNWEEICNMAVAAMNAVGIDVGAVDIKVQGKDNMVDPKFIILETNSAPSLGDYTITKYINKLNTLGL